MWIPWIGNRYDERRLLLLGESCYSWIQDGMVHHPDQGHPLILARLAMDPAVGHINFTRKLTRALTGVLEPNAQQSQDAWQSVAFTNYVPVTAGEGAGPNPNAQMWAQAAQDFPCLIEVLQPRHVIVLGYTMWRKMPRPHQIDGTTHKAYELENGTTVWCHKIRHPAYGPSWIEYMNFIIEAEHYVIND